MREELEQDLAEFAEKHCGLPLTEQVRQVTVSSCLKDRGRPVNIYVDQRSALEEAVEINCGILEDLNAELTDLESQLIVVKSQVDELTTITNGQREMYDRLGEDKNEID